MCRCGCAGVGMQVWVCRSGYAGVCAGVGMQMWVCRCVCRNVCAGRCGVQVREVRVCTGWSNYHLRGGRGRETSPARTGPNTQQHTQRYPPVEVPLLYGHSHHQPSKEEHVGVCEVPHGYLLGCEHTEGGEEDEGEEGSHGKGCGLCYPVYRHQHHDVTC